MSHVRKKPIRFSIEEIEVLEAAYENGSKEASKESRILAEKMNCDEGRIHSWFRRRKAKDVNILIRRYLTAAQKERLQAEYEKNPSPGKKREEEIAKELNFDNTARVRNWFAKRRVDGGHVRITKEEVQYLLAIFSKNKYPNKKEVSEIAKKINTTLARIRNWFYKQRIRYRKEEAKGAQRETTIYSSPKDKMPINRFATQTVDPAKKEILEVSYGKNPAPSMEDLQRIKAETNVDVDSIKTWFDRKRRIDHSISIKRLKTEELRALNKEYRKNKYPKPTEIDAIADRAGISRDRAQRWFYNQRYKDKDYILLPANRRKFKPEEEEALMEAYKVNPCLKKAKVEDLCDRFNLDHQRVERWFATKRARERKYEKYSRQNADQRRLLLASYEKTPRPSRKEIEDLAKKVGSTFVRITNWFSTTRSRFGCPKLKLRLSTEQRDVLMAAFEENHYLSKKKAVDLAKSIDYPERSVRLWFNDQSAKARKLRMSELSIEVDIKLEGMEMDIKMEDMKGVNKKD